MEHMMKVLGIRFCTVSKQAGELADFFAKGLGLPEKELDAALIGDFCGSIFPAGESWIEVWQEAEEMPSGTMLQIVVEDADQMAQTARENGLEPQGPMDAHGERIYFVQAPTGLQISFQSKIN
jgi:hypothetical protein